MGEELFIRGLKILYEILKGNYPGQSQITVGNAWQLIELLLDGENGGLLLIFLSELYQKDSRFLHIHKNFTYALLEKFNSDFKIFFKNFIKAQSTDARSLVYLFMFQRLLSVLISNSAVEETLKEPYHLTIATYLHEVVCKFVLPLFIDNHIAVESYYEPKLIKKNWNFETCFSLSAFMMLRGEHIRSMLLDFALSVLKLYNNCCCNIHSDE